MRILHNLKIDFGECSHEKIEAFEYDENSLMLQQGGDMILVPKSDAAAFGEALLAWISTGGKAT
jgi:hypothetical protein